MTLYYSGSVFSGGHPENLVPGISVMMTYHEIRNRVAKQQKRFKRLLKQRKKDERGLREGGGRP